MRQTLRILALLPLAAVAACTAAGSPGAGPTVGGTPGTDENLAALPHIPPGSLTPERLRGLRGAQVADALGAPSFIRRDPPAEIWQYRVPGCTLDLFLYEEGKGKAVAHYAVRAPSGATVNDRACLDEVQARRDGPPTS